ncbi:MAG: DUF1569 domain-containing protein [Planctomycetota bacterium]
MDTPTLAEIEALFAELTPASLPNWGRMDAAQMVRHCRGFVELCLGRVATGRAVRIAARMIGPLLLARMLRKSPKAAPRNLKTLKPLRTAQQSGLDLATERAQFFRALRELAAAPDPMPHPLYGATAREQVIGLVRHHTAHHLHQFGLL